MRLALGMALKFYTSDAKWSKLKIKNFLGLIFTFADVTGEKLVGGAFPPILNRVKTYYLKITLLISLLEDEWPKITPNH